MNLLHLALGLSILTSLAHSTLSERLHLRALRLNSSSQGIRGAMGHRLTTLMFHLPSLFWIAMAITLLFLDPTRAGDRVAFWLYAAIYAGSGVGNFWATRRPHPGGLLLLAIAGLVLITLLKSPVGFPA
jgi:hypothetical protein